MAHLHDTIGHVHRVQFHAARKSCLGADQPIVFFTAIDDGNEAACSFGTGRCRTGPGLVDLQFAERVIASECGGGNEQHCSR